MNNLPGVLVQQYNTTHEVVLVNDNSEDETKYLLEEFKKSFKNLNPVILTQEAKMINGKKFPLSIGIKSAKNTGGSLLKFSFKRLIISGLSCFIHSIIL